MTEAFRSGWTGRRGKRRFWLRGSGTPIALTTLLFACTDLLHEPASPPGTALVLTFAANADSATVETQSSAAASADADDWTSLTDARSASNRGDVIGNAPPRGPEDEGPPAFAGVFAEVDEVRVRIMREETVVRDTTVQLPPEGGDTKISIELELREDAETLGVRVELLVDGEPAFRDDVLVNVDAGDTTEVEVDPEPIPTEVRIAETEMELGAIGESVQLTAEVVAVTGEPIEGLELTWETLDPEIISVTPAGLVTALEEGVARVVGSYGALSDTVNVSVQRRVEVLVVDPREATLMEGETQQFSVRLLDSEENPVSGRSVTWTSSAETVATVDESGLVRGVSRGEAIIAAESGGLADTAEVIVLAEQYRLTVETAGNGTGTITSDPAGISCDDDCNEIYDDGTRVVLTATAGTGSSFDSWRNCPNASENTCSIEMTSARTVTATFTTTRHVLTVERDGNGTGTVTSEPAGISCGDDCSEAYDHGTRVVLTATSATGSTFASWTNCPSTSGSTCTVNLTGGRTITATFARAPVARVTIEPPADTIQVRETQQLRASVFDRDGTELDGRRVSWSSSNARVASVSDAGLVTGVAPGEVTITATSEGVHGDARVAVLPRPTAKPDLIVTDFEVTGSIIDANDGIQVPVRVVVQNQGTAAAGIFKMATEYIGPRGIRFLVPFTVRGQSSPWYPFTDRTLPAGSSVSFSGTVTFSSLRGAIVQLSAFADSCAGEEFVPAYCRVDESDEANNRSRSIELLLPQTGIAR